MSPTATGRRPVNPFATRFIRPGRIPPLDAAGRPLAVPVLAERARRGRFMAIVGPHGSGKSNLLASLAAHLAPCVVVVERRVRHGSDVPGVIGALTRSPRGAIVCIDGWERLGIAGRSAVRAVAAWRACVLVVTSHRSCGPVLARCDTTPVLLERIVAVLEPPQAVIGRDDIAIAYSRHSGNLREALLDLYDLFEHRIRGAAAVVRT